MKLKLPPRTLPLEQKQELLHFLAARLRQPGRPPGKTRLVHQGGDVTNDEELKATQERIARFQGWLAQMRQTARPEEFEAAGSGYRLEIERMQAEVMEYLLHPAFAKHVPQPA